jgi:acetyl-CoA carboxylase carboxyl transferase subunit beta
MPWYRKQPFTALKPRTSAEEVPHKVPDGLWHRCPSCLTITYMRDFIENLRVCLHCDFHEKLSSLQRLEMLLDEDSEFEECDGGMISVDPLGFVDSKPYAARLEATRKKSGLNDAVRCGLGKIGGQLTSLAIMDFGFVGGSMGAVVGEKITRAYERALEMKIPAITVCSSGGARMQESTFSLMQLAKTAAALAKLDNARLPHFVVLTNPSTAGVMASYGSLGDAIIAEPDALIGFAGPRVIEQTIKQTLPRGFQRSEFVMEHGFLDMVVHRRDMRHALIKLLHLLRGPDERPADPWTRPEPEEEAEEGSADLLTQSPAPAQPKAAGKPAGKKKAGKKKTGGKKKAAAGKKSGKNKAAKRKPAKG